METDWLAPVTSLTSEPHGFSVWKENVPWALWGGVAPRLLERCLLPAGPLLLACSQHQLAPPAKVSHVLLLPPGRLCELTCDPFTTEHPKPNPPC